jgi:heterotetrameric sarcosine oxidase gamma subunit
MPDRSHFWSPVVDWSRAGIRYQDLGIATTAVQSAWLVSGRFDMFLRARGGLRCVGPRETCDSDTYALRLAPDRLLFVRTGDAHVDSPASGWSDEGIAITDVSDGFVLLDIGGRAALDLMNLGAQYPFDRKPEAPAESALMLFAGLKVAVARLERGWRLHVERPYATALWQWLQHAASAWEKPPAAR